ncbi:bola protein [Hysterangium stoloniferum]|nr:bola protein [Hysterangium stoloniferum]
MSASSFLIRQLGNNFRISQRYFSQNLKARNSAPLNTPNTPAEGPVSGETRISNKLKAKFSPCTVQVQDVSGGCGDFYAINIASPAFKGIPIVKQHQMVQDVLKEEIRNIHGLQVTQGTKYLITRKAHERVL